MLSSLVIVGILVQVIRRNALQTIPVCHFREIPLMMRLRLVPVAGFNAPILPALPLTIRSIWNGAAMQDRSTDF